MAAKTKAPAWLKRPCGASFGFGGKLAQFTNSRRQLPTGEAVSTGSVAVSQVCLRCLQWGPAAGASTAAEQSPKVLCAAGLVACTLPACLPTLLPPCPPAPPLSPAPPQPGAHGAGAGGAVRGL